MDDKQLAGIRAFFKDKNMTKEEAIYLNQMMKGTTGAAEIDWVIVDPSIPAQGNSMEQNENGEWEATIDMRRL
jgi:hypothetical protein